MSLPRWGIAVFILSLIYIFPRCLYHNLEDGTADAGWIMALKFFVQNLRHHRWGTSVIYTYGPLGIFSTRAFPNNLWLWQVVTDLYVVFNLSAVFVYLHRQAQYAAAFLFSCCILLCAWDLSFLLQITSLFHFYIFCICERKISLWLIALTSIFLLYTKLNTVIFSVSLISSLVVVLLSRKKFVPALFFSFCIIAATIVAAFLLNADLLAYLYSAIDTISGFPENMYQYMNAHSFSFYRSVAFSILLLFIVLLRTSYKKPFSVNNLLLWNGLLLYYLLWKQGFTRMDREHMVQYVQFSPFVFLYICLVTEKRWYAQVLFAGSMLACSAYLVKSVTTNDVYCRHCANTLPLVTYLQQALTRPKKNEQLYFSPGSYDYCNFQCYKVETNTNKNWHNRPTLQSIASVSARLDSLNAAFYTSPYAPDTVYYDHKPLDNRNAWWDEPQLKWVILSRYRFADTQNGQAILIRRVQVLEYKDQLVADTLVGINEKLLLPKVTGLLTMKADIQYSFMGRLRSFLYQPPAVELVASGSDTTYRWRYIPPVFNGQQLIVNYFPGFSAVGAFLQNPNGISPNISDIRFHCATPVYLQKKVHVQLYKREVEM